MKGKYERTRVCLNVKTSDLKSFVLRSFYNNSEANYHLRIRDISAENNGSYTRLTNAVCNHFSFSLVTFLAK